MWDVYTMSLFDFDIQKVNARQQTQTLSKESKHERRSKLKRNEMRRKKTTTATTFRRKIIKKNRSRATEKYILGVCLCILYEKCVNKTCTETLREYDFCLFIIGSSVFNRQLKIMNFLYFSFYSILFWSSS